MTCRQSIEVVWCVILIGKVEANERESCRVCSAASAGTQVKEAYMQGSQ